MKNKIVFLLFFALFLAATACKSTTLPSLQPSEIHPPTVASDPSKTIFFPRQEKPDSERAVMDGVINGTLDLVDNCIRVDHDYSDTSYLLIWPPDFNMTVEGSSINILNENGETVAHIGDKVRIGGGEIKILSMLDKSIQEQVPSQCSAPYWIIGNEITTIEASK